MSQQAFRLIPFPTSGIPAIAITGNVSFQNNVLALYYSVEGNIENILLPSPSAHPSRRDELWKTTCFEFFLAIKDRPEYWEFNISPSGDWNVYRMDSYRRVGFREEPAISHLPVQTLREKDEFSMEVSVDVGAIVRPDHELQMAVTAVIQTKNGNETYWALAHPAPQADFHIRQGFILSLAAQTYPASGSAAAD